MSFEAITTFVSIFECFFVPLEISFIFVIAENFQKIRLVYLIFCQFDILLTFNTSIFIQGMLIQEHLQIAEFYMKNGFVFDFITIFPTFII